MKILLTLIFLISSSYAKEDFSALERRIQSQTENLVKKVLPQDKYVVQTFVKTSIQRVREVVEGQSQQQKVLTKPNIPKLPGFSLRQEDSGSNNKIESYRFVEKTFLDNVFVSLTFDETVADETIEKISYKVDTFLESAASGKYNLTVDKISMHIPPVINPLYFYIAGGVLLFLLTLVWLMSRNKKSEVIEPEVIRRNKSKQEDELVIPHSNQQQPMLTDESGLPPIPMSETYADKRTVLLNYYIRNSETFKDYYDRLGNDLQVEVYAALRGPAFENLLETLAIEVPEESEREINLSEEKLSYLIKDFAEYIDIHSWKTNQFFGFLDQLTEEQLLTTFRNENDLVAALMLKFVTPAKAAHLLDRVESSKRLNVLEQSSRIPLLKTDELSEIESMLREKVRQLPHFSLSYSKDDVSHWSQILMETENQEKILLDIEQVRPSLYPGLSKFRFNLEDIPTLPEEAVTKVVDECDNDELARALATCSKETINYVLAKVGERRRGLLESQIVSLRNLPVETHSDSKKSLTIKFREVMA